MDNTNQTCEINCDAQYCDVCHAQGISHQELMQIKLAVARAKLEYAKTSYNDIDVLLQTARSALYHAVREYERAIKKARESLI